MFFAFFLQVLGVALVLAGATLTGVGCCIAAALVVAGERFGNYPHTPRD